MTLLFVAFFIEGCICNILNNAIVVVGENASSIVSLFLLIINTILLILMAVRTFRSEDAGVVLCIVFGMLLRVFLLLWDVYAQNIFKLPNSHADTESFHRGAVLFSQGVKGIAGYKAVVGIIYSLFGVQRITAQYFNLLCSFMGIACLRKMLLLVDIDRERRGNVLKVTALIPNYMITSVILLRESLISCLLALSLLCFIQWWIKGRLTHIALAFAFSICAAYFHSGALGNMFGYSFVILFAKRDQYGKIIIRTSKATVTRAIMLYLIFLVIYYKFSETVLGEFGGVDSITDVVEGNVYTGVGGSGYSAGIPGMSSLLGMLVNTPIKVFYFLSSPLPWSWRGINDVIAFCFSAFFYTYSIVYGISTIKKNKEDRATIFALIIICLAGAVIFSWGVRNAGTALRHRDKFIFNYLLVFALALPKKGDSVKRYSNTIKI